MVGVQTVVYLRCAANQRNVIRQSNYDLKAINGAGITILLLETSEIQPSDSSGVHIIRQLGRQRDRDGGSADCSGHVPCLDRDVFSSLITKPYGGYSVAVVVFPE